MAKARSFNLSTIVLLAVCFFCITSLHAQDLPDGPGKDTSARVCTTCHPAEQATSTRRSKGDWEAIVGRMTDFGATMTQEEHEAIVNYLAANFGTAPRATKVNVNTTAAREIEAGLKLTSKEAEAIVKYREQNGNYKDWRDLLKVDGVDAKKIEAAKDLIVV
jgi:competence protein ComEA